METPGKIVVKCPLDDEEKILHEDCLKCPLFKHWGVRGARIYVSHAVEKG